MQWADPSLNLQKRGLKTGLYCSYPSACVTSRNLPKWSLVIAGWFCRVPETTCLLQEVERVGVVLWNPAVSKHCSRSKLHFLLCCMLSFTLGIEVVSLDSQILTCTRWWIYVQLNFSRYSLYCWISCLSPPLKAGMPGSWCSCCWVLC